MSVKVAARLDPDDLIRWREVCAGIQVAQNPTRDLAVEHAKRLWVEYYEVVAELHTKYEIPDEDSDTVTITVGNGLIYFDED